MTLTADQVRARLEKLQRGDLPTHGGRSLAYVYDSGRPDVDAVAREAVAAFAASNGLDPTVFPSLAAMERDLVELAAGLLDAPAGCAGTVTSGGTESCLLAVLAARDARSDVDQPRILAPTTVHAAFHKAAHLFGVALDLVDVDPVTYRADPAAMAAAVTADTVAVIASAPSYAHGVVDPIPDLAALAAARGLRCHVDACIGGWVLPFLPDAPPWSFAVDGVTSVSVDLHKYGYAPKGVSLLLHRSRTLRHSQFFATADWPGYGVVNATLQSTKSGGPVAAAWATAQLLGRAGYADLAGQARRATLAVADAVADLSGLEVMAAPDATLLALTTDADRDVYTLADELRARGWYTQPQLPHRGGPASLHLSFSAATEPLVPELVAALAESAAAAGQAGPVAVDPGLAATLTSLDPGALDEATLAGVLAAAGLAGEGGVALPTRMAPLHALLAACPAPLREALLIAVVERL